MNTKTLLAGLVGGVAAFFLGWLIYGKLLESYMTENFNQCANRTEEDFMSNMWAMGLGCLLWGWFMAIILSWANTVSFMSGLTRGATIGLVMCAAYGFQYYSMSTMYNSMSVLLVDVVIGGVTNAIIGGIVGWMLGRGTTVANA